MTAAQAIFDRVDRVISETFTYGAKIVTESKWHGEPWNCRRLHVADMTSEVVFDATVTTFPDDMLADALPYHAKLEASARTRAWIAERSDLSPAVLLRTWRAAEGLSIEDAAAALGVHRSTWGPWERGARRPEPHLRERLQDLTGTPADRWGCLRGGGCGA